MPMRETPPAKPARRDASPDFLVPGLDPFRLTGWDVLEGREDELLELGDLVRDLGVETRLGVGDTVADRGTEARLRLGREREVDVFPAEIGAVLDLLDPGHRDDRAGLWIEVAEVGIAVI